MMHSGDWPNSISERDLRVTASQLRADENDAREARFGEVTVDDFKTFLHDPFSREQVAERMKFLAAFANGDDVWQYSPRNYLGKSVPHWERVDFFDMHAEPRFLSLVWRDDEPAFHASHEALPTIGTTSDGAATALRGDAVE